MKLARKAVITALFLALMLLFGCSDEEVGPKKSAFVGGSEGLEITFLNGMPPDEVFDVDNPFQIGVKVENKGEYDITSAQDVKVTITGINPADFGAATNDLARTSTETLKGVRLDGAGNKLNGDYVTLDFPSATKENFQYAKQVAGSVPFTIRANVCYEYGTRAQGKLCIRKDLRGVTGEEGVCSPDRQLPAENSGAPIQITNIRQNVAGSDKIDFFFTIKKVGAVSDSVHKTGSACDTALANKDVVLIKVSDTGLGELKCSGLKSGDKVSVPSREGYVTLFDNEREIRCTQTLTSPDDFEKVIDINLEYAYKEFVDKTLIVKHTS